MIISNRYRLIEKLGQGGVGVVFRAADRLSGDFVALKQLRVAVADLDFATRQAATGLLDKNLALAFEFRTLAGLRHPNVVSVLDYGFDQEHQPFFTMQLIEDASTILEYGQQASLDVKVRLLVEMLQALTYLHRRDIIHRDLKPSNVLISASGTLKMMDFGLAVSHSQTISTGQTGIAGTLAYMAPEMFEGENASIQSDLFAIGIISYELFAGRYPFDSKSTAMLLHSIINSTVDTTMLEPKLAAVVDKLLAKTPAGRYDSAPAVIEALLEATDQPRPQESISIRESYLQASEFVGRQQELETLKAALEDMLSDPPRGSAWLIGGESGVGKSRLVDELRIRALTRGALVLRGQGVAGGGLPYQLWRGPLRRLVLHTEPGKTDAAVLKDLVPDIGTLLAYDVPDAVTLEGRESQQRLVGAIVSMFQRIQQPVVLILEDLQWALDSLEPLKSLSNILHDLPLLIVANYRDDESPELPDLLNNLRALKLERLGDQAIEELSASMLGSIGKRIDLIELLKRETEGNVFFIVEVVRMLAEEAGGLDDIGRKSLPDRVFAGGMKEVIQRRLRRVPEWGQELLKLSAVAGREVDLKLLAHWTADFEPWLTICANAAVLEVREGRWRFAHDKLREALIAELSPEERPHLHEQIATAIEAVYPHGDTWAVVLLEHWRQAGDPQREIEYALAAVNVLWSTSSLREAAEIAARTLPKIPDDSTRAVMLRQLGEVHFGLGNIEEASEIFQQSMALARTIDDRLTIALCLSNLGHIHLRQADHDHSCDYYEQSLTVARELNDLRLISQNLEGLGDVAAFQSDFVKANVYYQESLEINRRIDHKRGIAGNLNGIGWVASSQSDYETCRRCFEQSLEIAQEIGDRRGVARSMGNLGAIASAQGNFATALAYYQQQLQIHRETGLKAGIAWSLWALSRLMFFQGDYAAASEQNLQSLAINRELGDKTYLSANLRVLGQIAYAQGDYPAARRYQDESLALAQEIGQQLGITAGYIFLGQISAAMGEWADTQFYFDQGLALTRDLNFMDGIADSLNGLGWTALCRGAYALARTHFEEALAVARQITYVDGIATILIRLGLLAAATHDYAAAADYYHESLDLARRLGLQHQIASALVRLGLLELDQQVWPTAYAHLIEGLRLANTIGAQPVMLEALIGLAEYFLAQGEIDRSLELAAVAHSHPALAAGIVRSRLDAVTPREGAAEASPAASLDSVVCALLDPSAHSAR